MVNTFLPYSSFRKVARVLDNKRLGKQRVEGMQILNIVSGKTKSKAWINHPVVKQWIGYDAALKYYINTMIDEWIRRGFRNNMQKYELPKKIKIPWFVRNKLLNLSHQASLLRKYPEYYKKHFKVPKEFTKYSYVWISALNAEQLKAIRKADVQTDIGKYAKLFNPL